MKLITPAERLTKSSWKKALAGSLLKKVTKPNETLQLRFELVKHILEVLQAEQEAREHQAYIQSQRRKILELIEQKKDQELVAKSVDELIEELDKLK